MYYTNKSHHGSWDGFVLYDETDLRSIQEKKDIERFSGLHGMLTDEEQKAFKTLAKIPLTPQEVIFMFSRLTNNFLNGSNDHTVYTDDIIKQAYKA